jgi:hypothetical protein
MPRRFRRLTLVIVAFLALVALSLLLHFHRAPRAAGPLSQEAYVWQRLWTPEVGQAVSRAKDLGNLVVLAAEIDLRQEPPRISQPAVDWRLLAAARPRAGLALRILPFPGRFADRPRGREAVLALAAAVAASAHGHGLSPAEIQLDYDCAESKLDDYSDFIFAVRRAVSPLPVTVTALPSWLTHRRSFAALVAAADGYVLQVHSLRAPEHPGDPGLLCDPAAARQAVERAARFRRPFRVALPTYGYVAAFDRGGALLGLAAEGPALAWPAGAVVSPAVSDPAAIAGLVRGWTRDRPRELSGLLWYRLPVAGDQRNWSWATFQAVRTGIAPRGEVRAVIAATEPELFDLSLVNSSTTEASPPATIRVRWKNAPLLAADGLAGYRVRPGKPDSPDELWLERPATAPPGAPLRPGERRAIGWLRFAVPAELEAEAER